MIKKKGVRQIEQIPKYKADKIANIYARFEQHAEAKRWFPEFFGDKIGEFIIVDEVTKMVAGKLSSRGDAETQWGLFFSPRTPRLSVTIF